MENQRVRISKKMLKDALLELLQDKDIAHVSVTEICQHAQINRTTFYKHYGSQYDLLDDAMDDFFRGLAEDISGNAEGGGNALARALDHLNSQRDRARTHMTALPGDAFEKRLFAQPFIASFRDDVLTRGLAGAQAHHAGLFFESGVYAIVREWIASDNPEPPAQIAQIIFTLRKKFEGVEP